MRPIKHVEKGLSRIAGGLFNTIQFFNQYRPNESFTPKWSEKPLLKSWQKSKPPLGFPRTTDSLCPKCVIEARNKILSAPTIDPSILVQEKVGDIQAHNDENLHNHGSSSIKYGRGSVLTIDLTNRCNMMCDPCFMDANQVGFV